MLNMDDAYPIRYTFGFAALKYVPSPVMVPEKEACQFQDFW